METKPLSPPGLLPPMASLNNKDPRSLPLLWIPLLLLVASALLIFLRLGDIEMRRYDESLYALRAKEMYLSGHLMAPMQKGKVAWSSGKPPFGFWLIILSFRLFGLNPLALRLPFALAGVGCVLLLFFIGQRLKDPRLGLFSALSLLLMPGFLKFSRQAILEPILTVLFLATLLLFHQAHRFTGYPYSFLWWLWPLPFPTAFLFS